MAESCYDDSVPAQPWNFIKLVTKYGFCQDTLGTPGDIIDGQPREVLDPCNDLYILMCFAAAQVAVGSVQILSCIIGKMKNKNKVGSEEGVSDVDGTGADDASNGGMTVLGVLSWIAGIIMLSIYTSVENFETSLPNSGSLRFYNSFKAAVILNVVLFSFGLLFILTITGIFVFSFIFKKGRLGTLFTFIFSVIIMGIATSFYGCIAYYGWPYVHGDCLTQIEKYENGTSTNTVTLTIDTNWLLTEIDVDANKTVIENDLKAILEQKWYAGPQAECMVDDDCEVVMDVCNSGICGTVPPTTTTTTTKSTTKASGTIRRAKNDGNSPVPDPVCAKGLDCGKGKTCKNGQCEANAVGTCGSRLDCKIDEICAPQEENQPPTCGKRLPELNPFYYEYGQYFYNTNCTLNQQSDSIRTGELKLSCEFEFEADAIIYRIEHPLEDGSDEGNGDAFYSDDSLECNLLDQQFRQFQLDMLTLKAFEGEKLALNDCSVEQSVKPTPLPTSPMPETTSALDGAW